jgi:HPt (histidine-containing phosphotransfer) domain-containing protein
MRDPAKEPEVVGRAREHDEPVPEELADLMTGYIGRAQDGAREAREALDRGDLEGARRYGHRIAGTAGSFGAFVLGALARALEAAVRTGDPVAIAAALTAMDARLVVMATAL